MRDVLVELAKESYRLRNPDLLVGYRERTQLERLLFLALREYCLSQLNYDLRGLTLQHQSRLADFLNAVAVPSSGSLLMEGFAIAEEIRDLQAQDPYTTKHSVLTFSSERSIAVRRLTERISSFISEMRPLMNRQATPSIAPTLT
jgi:hypothetical protein